MSTAAIILAGGTGDRFCSPTPKQYVKVSGKLIIEHTIEVFELNENIDEIYLVIHKDYIEKTKDIVISNSYKKIKKIVAGGDNRQESSKFGLLSCSESIDKVLLHDSVRPYIDDHIINLTLKTLDYYDAVDVAVPATDTIIEVNENIISSIPERKFLYCGQTPQGFKLSLIKKAHKLADEEGYSQATDDCSLILRYNLAPIFVIDGSEYNIKITNPLDIYIADKISQIKNIKMKDFSFSFIKKELHCKVIVVFGGSSGIGSDILNIGKCCNSFIYSYSRRNGIDVKNYNDIESCLDTVFKKHGRIDHIICTAGLMKMSFLETMSIEDIKEQIDTNLLGSFYIAKSSIKYLKRSKGSLTFFSSSSYSRGRRGYTPYSSSKAAIVNMVQGLADELSCFNIRVNVICPERTLTPLRINNFGKENESSLLSSIYVALVTLRTIVSGISDAIIDVKKSDEIKDNSYICFINEYNLED